jgi:cell division transport system permease protein
MRILLGEAWRGLRAEPLAAVIAAVVVGLALYIPAMLFLLSRAGERYGAELQAQVKLRAYVHEGIAPESTELLGQVRALPGVKSARWLDRDMLLAELEGEFGADLTEGLPANPLPDAVEISVQPGFGGEDELAALAARVEALTGVDDVVYGRAWAHQAERFFGDLRVGLGVLVVLLSVLVLAIASNTIRLTIRTRREAIGVWLLLGASPLYARIPYYIEGAIAGLAGALFTLALVGATAIWLRHYIPTLDFFSVSEAALFLAIAIAMSLVGAVAAARRHIVPL